MRFLQAPQPTPTDLADVTDQLTDEVGQAVSEAGPYVGPLIALAIAVGVAIIVTLVVVIVMRQVFRKQKNSLRTAKMVRLPTFLATFFLVARIALNDVTIEGFNLLPMVQWGLLLAGIGSLAWLFINIVRTAEASVLDKYADASVTDRRARKLKTQTVLIRRILVVVIVIIAISVALLMIPAVRAVGAGIMASAGILSVIAGLAVQSSLANLFAGLQIVFTDALRVGDVVEVEEYFGTVEDITLTYVVIKIWDERRVIYPSTFFTTDPFVNYTRTGSSAFGTVELEVDWDVPVDAMRERLAALVESTDLWDRRDRSIQVVDALGGMAKVRIVVSAENTGNLWDLRTMVREDMINFLRTEYPQAIYRQRHTSEPAPLASPLPETEKSKKLRTLEDVFAENSMARGSLPQVERKAAPPNTNRADATMFTGTMAAVERGLDYLGPGEEAYKERKERTETSDSEEEEK